ncbi:MAG TPA: type II toxin-antitoxin system death-on-curing family toxin [Acetobacteraceae bacterium]|nr:type II toxin-antitoxin system death-on-curing family toxin [Acetobacteraceae bacterium]
MTVWLSRTLILAVHDEQLAQHGGASGIRDMGLLESALSRPANRAAYGDPDIAEPAALYAIALARNHPFVDGNKPTAYVALELCLRLNGLRFPVSDAEAAVVMLQLAASEISDEEFTTWVRQNAVP